MTFSVLVGTHFRCFRDILNILMPWTPQRLTPQISFLKNPLILNSYKSGACFSKDPVNCRARKVSFSWSVSNDRKVYAPETYLVKRTPLHFSNTWIKQLCNQKVWDFATAFRVRNLFGTFEKRIVRKVDNAIHRINHYPADSTACFVNTYPLDSDLSGE